MSLPPLNPTLDFLAAIYRLQSLDSLALTILRELPRLIPCDNVMIGHHDGTRRSLTGLALRHPFTHSQFLIEASRTGHIAGHPFWDRLLSTRQPIKILSEMAPGRHWLENPLYRDVLREDNVRDQLNVEFGPSIADFTSVSVIRSTIGFHQSERDTLQILLPHLTQAFANARFIASSLTDNTHTHTSAIPITHDNVWNDPASREKIRTFLAASSTHHIPRLDPWLATSLDQLNRGAPSVAPLRVRHHTHASLFLLQRDWLHRRYRLLHRFTSSPSELLARSLSKKESEILFWIAEGKSNPEIATLLAISLETVKTHLKRIFRKLGVDSRTAAASHARPSST